MEIKRGGMNYAKKGGRKKVKTGHCNNRCVIDGDPHAFRLYIRSPR